MEDHKFQTALRVACWRIAGLGAKNPKLVKTIQNDGVWAAEVRVTTCNGDICAITNLTVPLADGSTPARPILPEAGPDTRLTFKLLTQPAAIAAIVGLLTLLLCVLNVSNPVAALLLSLVGGEWWGKVVLAAAMAAHFLEGLFVYFICLFELKLSFSASKDWAALVLAVGFPVTRWVLKLRHKASQKA